MSGIVSGINYSLLFSSDSSSVLDASSSILTTLYSTSTGSSTTTAVSTGDPLLDLKLAQANEATDVAQEEKDPTVTRDISAFQTAIANSTNIQQALANPDVQKVLLTANGLSSYIGDTALVQKAFLSDPNDPNSLVNQLGDNTLLSAVKTYNFATTGLSDLQNPQVVSTLTNAYAEVLWRQSLDQATPGLSNALSFLGNANTFTNVDQILGDATARSVITTALGIPEEIAFQDITAQETAITSRLDISKLQDPKFVTSLTDQYLLTMQQQSQSSGSDSTSLTSLAVQAGGIVV